MKVVGHLSGGAEWLMRYPIRATVSDAGQIGRSVTDAVGIAEATTTSFADAVGITIDTATYSTTQADLDDPGSDANIGAAKTVTGLDMGRVVTVSIRPDLICEALCSGGSTESTALTLLVNTAASAGGTVITDTDVGSADMVSGTVWGTKGANSGLARIISAHSASTSFTVTIPFPRAIAVNDEFLWVPYNCFGTRAAAIDGSSAVQTTTLGTQADASIASGTGGAVSVVYLALNGRNDSKVYFILADHALNQASGT